MAVFFTAVPTVTLWEAVGLIACGVLLGYLLSDRQRWMRGKQ